MDIDDCDEPVVNRVDDTEEVIIQRNKNYLDLIEPILDYYGDSLIRVNANQTPEKFFQEIIYKLNN